LHRLTGVEHGRQLVIVERDQIGGILGDPQRPNLGDREGAVRQFERAKALAVSLLTPSASYEVVEVLVRAGNQLTSLYSAKGDAAAAVASAREAVEYAARYVRDHPDDARGPKLRAASNFYLAWSLPDVESVAVWEEALAYYEGELAKAPTAENRRNAALMAKYLASTLTDLGQGAKAEAHFVRALALDEQRLAAAPDDRQTMLDAAISYGQMGEFLQKSGQTHAAAERYARGVALRRRSVEADPKDVMAQGRLAWGLMRLGEAQRTLGATIEARTLFREAITVQEGVATVTGDLPAQLQLADLWFELAVLESGEGQSPVACEAYREVQRILGTAKAPLSEYNSGLLKTAQTKVAGCG